MRTRVICAESVRWGISRVPTLWSSPASAPAACSMCTRTALRNGSAPKSALVWLSFPEGRYKLAVYIVCFHLFDVHWERNCFQIQSDKGDLGFISCGRLLMHNTVWKQTDQIHKWDSSCLVIFILIYCPYFQTFEEHLRLRWFLALTDKYCGGTMVQSWMFGAWLWSSIYLKA